MPRADGRQSEPVWERVLSGDAEGPGYDALRNFLFGASRLYGSGLQVYLHAEEWGLRTRTTMPVPVLSIGNLSVGGTGKTPMAQYIARRLLAEGWQPAILSRGYRGTLNGRNLAVSGRDGTLLLAPQEAGDEPFLLARSLSGVPVIVGKDRRISGRLAIRQCRSDVLLLDDGFQYWQMARDLDIVLLDARRPFENGHALPRGLLREPKQNLARAGLIVFTRSDGLTQAERDERMKDVRGLAPEAHVFWSRHVASGWKPLNAAAAASAPKQAVAVCGIAQPASFLKSVQACGVRIVGEPMIYADHQQYGLPEIDAILGKIKDYTDTAMVTTEKDAAKLNAHLLPVPAYALEVRIEIEDADAFWSRASEILLGS